MASKYALNPSDILKMTESELKDYIRGSTKVINDKLKKIKATGQSEFSETVYETEQVTKMLTGIESQKLSASVRGKNKNELQRQALLYNKLANISETPSQLKEEYDRNINNIFKTPRYTRKFLESERKNRKFLAKLVNKNIDFIYTILPSDIIRKNMESAIDTEEKYYQLLIQASDTLDEFETEEKEQILEKWKVPDDLYEDENEEGDYW